jgi:exosortase
MKLGRNTSCGLLLAFSIAFWWSPIASTLQLAWTNEAFTHILLIVPLSFALAQFASERPRKKSDSPTLDSENVSPVFGPGGLGGLFLLAATFGFACFVRWDMAIAPDVQLSLSMITLVVWWIAIIGFCFGFARAWALAFPLLFLLWIVPFPDFLFAWIVPALQNGSALAARWMFQFAHVPVTQNGVLLSVPGLDIEVARECSSIRSSLLLIIVTMFLAQLFLKSPWTKWLLVLLALPLSVAKNGLRIFVITELALQVDPGFLDGKLHHHGGIVFLTIALAVVGALLWVLMRWESVASSQLSALRSP